jgi:hypothetical protein
MLREKAAAAKLGAKLAGDNPCGFMGKVETVEGVVLTGTGDHPTCLRDMRAQLTALQAEDGSELRMPPELEGRAFLGMALLYHLTHFLSVAVPERLTGFPRSTVAEISGATTEVCGWRWEKVVEQLEGRDPNTPTDRLSGRCFDGVLVEALLSDGSGDGGGGGGGGGGGWVGMGDKVIVGGGGSGGGLGGNAGGGGASKKSGFGFARKSALISFVVGARRMME